MVKSSGAKLLFVRGATVAGEAVHHFHANYRVPVAQVLQAMDRIHML
jgi:hypothetical protein